ncbi:MAG TPA: adenylate/guanylate cyclase domain-containing protein, partial [Methylomirabilota bacterium]|nr:adenylate/guanylate cyclase domain-containing protein [Methylomirabilota bacterium]
TQRKLVAILAADVVGYSRLMEEDEAATVRDLQAHQAVILPTVDRHGGRVIDTAGDGVLAEFPSVLNAAECAIDIQTIMTARNEPQPESRRMRFRIGINLGDVIHDANRIYGDGVNVAARLQTYAEPGGVVVSGAVAEQIVSLPGVHAVNLGELHLRNISRPVRAFALRMGDVRVTALGDAPVAAGGRPSIVVLPFRKNQSDPDDAYFADGIVDNIIYALAGLKELFVISRGSTLGYGGATIDVRAIGRELGVRYVMYGSVQRSAGHLRIATELSDAETGTIVLSERYDSDLSGLFKVQDTISTQIVTAIAPHVRQRERLRAMRKHPKNLTAYDLVLQALGPLYEMDYESFSRARGLLQQAMAFDPGYAPAYSYAAYWHMFRIGQGWSPDERADITEAARIAAAAIERDPADALALAIYGHVHSFLMKDYDAAVEYLDRALAAGPSCALAWTMSSATCGYLGQGAIAVLRAEHGLRLSPLDSHVFFHEHILSQAHYINGNYDEAIAWARKAAQHNARLTSNLRVLASSLVAVGKTGDAMDVARQLLSIEPRFGLRAFAARTPLRDTVRDAFVDRLRAAGLPD